MKYVKLLFALCLSMGYGVFAKETAVAKQCTSAEPVEVQEDPSAPTELFDPGFEEFFNSLTDEKKKEYMEFSLELSEICAKAGDDLDSLTSICEPLKKMRNEHSKEQGLTLQVLPKDEEVQELTATIDQVLKDSLYAKLSKEGKDELKYALQEAIEIGKESGRSIEALCARYNTMKGSLVPDLNVMVVLATPTRAYILKA